MRIIIIGASGLIGNALFKIACDNGINVVGTYSNNKRPELIHYDMTEESIFSVIPDIGSNDVVFLLSAFSNPTWIFENQNKAKQLNLDATKNIINDLAKVKARIIFMSSVEVFDGKVGLYNEQSIPAPLNLYGQMKLSIEKHLKALNCHYCIVRTGWNVGWELNSRCVISLTYETLMRPKAKMANDNTFSIIDVINTANALLKLLDYESLNCIHIASNPYIRRDNLANMVKLYSKYGKNMKYEITSFSKILYSEPRAQYNNLDNTLACSLLGVKFKNSNDIIQQKVKLLDIENDKR